MGGSRKVGWDLRGGIGIFVRDGKQWNSQAAGLPPSDEIDTILLERRAQGRCPPPPPLVGHLFHFIVLSVLDCAA